MAPRSRDASSRAAGANGPRTGESERLRRRALLEKYVALASLEAKGEASTVTKKDLFNRIAECTGETKVVTKATVQLFLDAIVFELSSGNRLEFRDFGVFEIRERRARRAQNPRTLEKVAVPPKRVVKFKVGRNMREFVTTGRPFELPPGGDDD
ncbi:MAG: HU family DNA-binding protein [Planctomycetes bacterium]|nr:HU family DNA-binding protein [Planctomycetota bacterium]